MGIGNSVKGFVNKRRENPTQIFEDLSHIDTVWVRIVEPALKRFGGLDGLKTVVDEKTGAKRGAGKKDLGDEQGSLAFVAVLCEIAPDVFYDILEYFVHHRAKADLLGKKLPKWLVKKHRDDWTHETRMVLTGMPSTPIVLDDGEEPLPEGSLRTALLFLFSIQDRINKHVENMGSKYSEKTRREKAFDAVAIEMATFGLPLMKKPDEVSDWKGAGRKVAELLPGDTSDPGSSIMGGLRALHSKTVTKR